MNINRPISPHLTVYKLELHTVLSILHRITGGALSVALCFFVILLKLFSFNLSSYAFYAITYDINYYSGFILLSIGFLLLAATVYHLLTGIRHMIWDFWDVPYVYEIEGINMSCYIILGLASFITLSLWIII
jgi:succinate dehydrogenase / fumarate reductase cytochrome b subunit